MSGFVGLLRGINVGGHRKVPMARLREVAEGLGWTDVRTYVQSGNLVFAAPSGAREATLGTQLSEAIETAFGFDVAVVMRSHADLAAVVAADPLGAVADDPARHHVLFLSEAPDPSVLDGLHAGEHAPDVFVLHGREIHLWTPNGIRDSRLARGLTDKRLGVTVTARNWRTVEKLVAMTA